jgi:hypothetical protein
MLTTDQMEEIGMDQLVQCIKFKAQDNLEDTFVTITLNILGIMYSVRVPKHEADSVKNIQDAWAQVIQDFGVYHTLGHSKKIQHGSRDLTDEEQKIIDVSPKS